ncbi:cubilin-like [Clavelina lepadiformis]|uniref:cubilin-like n=1 Tax=Clavelina lepadiformis TaxID=159417 RepID=UPI004041EA73
MLFVTLIIPFVFASVNACHYQLQPKLMKAHDYMSECLSNKTGYPVKAWSSIFKFVVLDTKWFQTTLENVCAESKYRFTRSCWKSHIKEIFRTNSSLYPITLQCMDGYKTKATQPTVSEQSINGWPNEDEMCLKQNATAYEMYINCFNSSLRNAGFENVVELPPILWFVQNHWVCDKTIPGSCSPKIPGTCPISKWPRFLQDITKPSSLLKMLISGCNEELFNRPSGGCKQQRLVEKWKWYSIRSPGYPNVMGENDYDCTYAIKPKRFFKLEMKIIVDTEKCCDFVTIFFPNSTILAKLSGKVKRTFLLDSHENSVNVNFHTDESVTSKGFVLRYRKVCRFNLKSTTSMQKTFPPTFKQLSSGTVFGEEIKCIWTIKAPSGEQVFLRFDKIHLENADRMEVFDGPVRLRMLEETDSRKDSIKSQNGMLIIHYQSNSTKIGNGFHASFATANSCGGSFAANNNWQEIVGEAFHVGGNNILPCWWNITASPGYAILLKMNSKIRKYGKSRNGQRIEVFENRNRVYSVYDKNFYFASNGNQLLIHQNYSRNGSVGFVVSFKQEMCNVTILLANSVRRTVQFAYFPSINRRHICTYTVRSTPERKIHLTLKTYELKSNYLEVFSGNISLGRADLTGPPYIHRLTSIDNEIQLRYVIQGSMFLTEFNQFTPNCGSSLIANANYQDIFSPGNPSRHIVRCGCEWIITASPGKQIVLTIFDSQGTQDSSFIRVYDKLLPLGTYATPRFLDVTLVSSTNLVRIQYRQKADGEFKGFQATYKETINMGWNDVKAFGGTISTEKMFMNTSMCLSNKHHFWNIYTSRDYRIKFTIESVRFSTANSFLQIQDSSSRIGWLHQNSSVPRNFLTSTHTLRVCYYTDDCSSPEKEHFVATIKQVCQKDINIFGSGRRDKGIFTKMFDKNETTDCHYNFVTAFGSKIQLTLYNISIRDGYINVTAGNQTLYHYTGSSSGSPTTATLISPRNKMTLHYHAPIKSSSNGFRMRYEKARMPNMMQLVKRVD